MPLEIILGILVVGAIVVFSVVVSFANKENAAPQPIAIPVPPAALKEVTPIKVEVKPVVVEALVKSVREGELEVAVKRLEEQLSSETENLSAANDALRFDNQSLKKELMEMTDKFRDLLIKFDQLKATHEASEAGNIKEKEIVNDQLVQEVEDLRRTQAKLIDLNATMTTKADLLQYELIKARAQATGYERISQNYQQQIEQLMGGKAPSNRLQAHAVES